jgi:hypothetical protein
VFPMFVLARVAALPLDDLIDTAPPKTTAHVESAMSARAEAEAIRSDLEQVLHSAVPNIEPRSRLGAIELKRAVHNFRPAKLTSAVRRDLNSVLKPQDGSALSSWLDAQERFERRLRDAELSHREEILTHVRRGLQELAGREAFLQPLIMASRSFYERVVRQTEPPPTCLSTTKRERSILSYAARASAKTSPFSTFMHLALIESESVRDRSQRLDAADRASRTSLNRGVIFSIRRHSFGCCGDRRHASFAMSANVKWIEGDSAEVMAPRCGVVEHRLLRISRCARMRFPRNLALRLNRLPAVFTWVELIAALTSSGVSAIDADLLSERLYDYGVIDLLPWTDAFQPHPETSALNRADQCSAAGPVVMALDRMGRNAVAVNCANSGQRAELLALIDTDIEIASRVVQADLSPVSRNPVMEDGFFRNPVGPISTALQEIIEEVALVLQPRVVPNPSYAALRQLYVDLYGAEGNCYDVMDFLCRAASVPVTDLRVSRKPRLPTSQFARQAVPVTVLMQIAGDPEESTSVDNILAVINRVYMGCGWLCARYATGDQPFHESLREALRKWIAAVAAPAEPIDVLVSGDCNSLQAHPKLTDRVLVSPLEPCLDEGKLSLRDVWLRCAASGRIEMVAGEKTVAPVYLGTTFPNPAWGPLYWLTVLAAPWCVAPFDHPTPDEETVPGVFHSARRSIGRVVTERASWLMPAERLRRLWFGRREALRTADVAMDCAKLGIPRRFFVRESAPSSYGSRMRKPMWIDTRNPFMLDLLQNLLRDSEHLRITEALPDRPQWPILTGRPHVAELHVEMAL